MVNEVERGWTPAQVYAMAGICLLVGIALGYFFRGSASPAVPTAAAPQVAAAANAPNSVPATMPSLEDMKRMADKRAEPLLDKLKSDPKNVDVLNQVAHIYETTHQFPAAASYYGKVLEINPKDVATRTQMASDLYYGGDVDGALNQLKISLESNPKDANSLFNLGMIRLQGKKDAKGALEAWTQLLKSNPQLDATKKAQLEKVMAQVRQQNKTN